MFVVFCLETFAIFMPIYRLTSQVVFPDPNDADPDGLLAYGGDLRPQRLLLAYAQGIFSLARRDKLAAAVVFA